MDTQLVKENPLDRLRAICLTLPEATEQGGVGDPSFKVRDKIFAMQHRFEERPSMWCKAPPGAQDVLVNSKPEQSRASIGDSTCFKADAVC